MKDVCTVSSSALPANTRVAGVRGSEALSSIYTFDVYALMTHDLGQSFNMADAIGAKATLTLDRGDGRPPFQFHGIFSAVELVHEFGGRAVFRATLVPHLWQLTQTMHSRLFTDQSIPDIIKTLQGANPKKLIILVSRKAELNEKGEILDPWGTPLRIYFSAAGVLVRSAGQNRRFDDSTVLEADDYFRSN